MVVWRNGSGGILLLIALGARAALAALATECVGEVNGAVTPYVGGGPCGVVTSDSPFTSCCNRGSVCVGFGICELVGSLGAGISGYYYGGCTDPSYSDPSCTLNCVDFARHDIVYDAATNSWACCGTYDGNGTDSPVNCSNPSTETFKAPAPSSLTSTFSVGDVALTATPTSSPTPSANPSSTPSPSSTPPPAATTRGPTSMPTASPPAAASDAGLSAGAKAGIGIGTAVAVVAVIGLGVFFFVRGRRRASGKGDAWDGVGGAPVAGKRDYGAHEMGPAAETRAELDARNVHELSNDGRAL